MINHIELAKECCKHIHTDEASDENNFVEFTADQLSQYTNAIIEQCAKVAEEYDPHYGSEVHIRALKVKG